MYLELLKQESTGETRGNTTLYGDKRDDGFKSIRLSVAKYKI